MSDAMHLQNCFVSMRSALAYADGSLATEEEIGALRDLEEAALNLDLMSISFDSACTVRRIICSLRYRSWIRSISYCKNTGAAPRQQQQLSNPILRRSCSATFSAAVSI